LYDDLKEELESAADMINQAYFALAAARLRDAAFLCEKLEYGDNKKRQLTLIKKAK